MLILRRFADAMTLALTAADMVTTALQGAVDARGVASVALSGGSTPQALYAQLCKAPYRNALPWQDVRWYMGDERAVPPDDRLSNFRMLQECLFDTAGLPVSRLRRIEAEHGRAAAPAYERVLRQELKDGMLDVALLGLGADGHTAGIFPGTPWSDAATDWVVSGERPDAAKLAISLSVPMLRSARLRLMLVAGEEKQTALRRLLQGANLPSRAAMEGAGMAVVLADEAACRMLP